MWDTPDGGYHDKVWRDKGGPTSLWAMIMIDKGVPHRINCGMAMIMNNMGVPHPLIIDNTLHHVGPTKKYKKKKLNYVISVF